MSKRKRIDLKAEELDIADLVENPSNARTHTPRNIGTIVESVQYSGVGRSGVVDEANMLLAGHGAKDALIEAGIRKVIAIDAKGDEWIVVRRRGLTEAQKTVLAIADNRANELSTWDPEILRSQLESVGGSFAVDKLGFNTADLVELTGQEAAPGRTDPDDIPTPRETGIARGDLFALGRHRLLCGDSTNPADVARLTDGIEIEMIATDPPYCSGGFQEAGKKAGSIGTRGTEMIANDTLSTRGYIALIKSALQAWPVGLVYLFTDWRMWVNLFDAVESSGFGVRNMIVWDKETPGMGRGWRSQHELIMCGSRVSQPFDPKKAQGNVIRCTRTGNVHHPTEKPVELIGRILDVSDMARMIGDPFCGSGTTVIACEQSLNRRCFAMDLDPEYVQVTIDRWEAFTGGKAEKL